MAEISSKQEANIKNTNNTASVVAGISGKTERLVRMVINEGKVKNDPILAAAVTYEMGVNKAIEEAKIAYNEAKTELIKSIEKAVPFK